MKVGEQIPNQWVDKGSEDGSPILRGSVQLDPAAAANVFNAGGAAADTTQRYLFECKKSDGTAASSSRPATHMSVVDNSPGDGSGGDDGADAEFL